MAKHLYEQTLGVHIEGIPSESGHHHLGTIFYYGDSPFSLGFVDSNYAYEPLLAEIVGSIDGRIDPYNGSFDLSASGIVLTATDSLCKRLMVHAPSPRWNVVAYTVDTFFTGTLEIDPDGYDPPVVGEHIYIGDETLYVDDIDPSGTGTYLLQVIRGIGDSVRNTLEAGTDIYPSPPYHEKRVVTLYLYEPGASEPLPLWQGLIQEVQTDSQQTVIEITAYELLSTLVSAKGNERPNRFGRSILAAGSGGSVQGTVFLDDAGSIEWASRTSDIKCLKVGDTYLRAGIVDGNLLISSSPQLGSELPDIGALPADIDIEEVFFLDREGKYDPTSTVTNPFTGLYGTKLHPASVALAFLLSTGTGTNTALWGQFDVLGRFHGLGIPPRMIDFDAWRAIIDAGLEPEIDQLLIEGDIDFQDLIVRRLLLPAGLFPAINNRGKLSLFRLEEFTVDDIAPLLASKSWSVLTPDRIDIDRNLSKQVSSVTARYGAIADVEQNQTTTRILRGNRTDTGSNSGGYEFDFSLYYRERSIPSESGIPGWVEDQAQMRREHVPTLHCVVPLDHEIQGRAGMIGGSVPSLGAWILIEGGPETGVVGPDGSRVYIEHSSILFIGLLIGRTLNIVNRTVECEILLLNWLSDDRATRVVAPSGLVTSYNDATERFTLANDSRRSSIDTVGFMVGDEVRVYRSDGNLVSGIDPLVITLIDEATRRVEVSPPFPVALITSALAQGAVYLRLVDRTVYDNDGWDGASYFGAGYRRFTYISGSGTASIDRDRYS